MSEKSKDVSKPHGETLLQVHFLSAEEKQKLLKEHQQLMEENKKLMEELQLTVTSTACLIEAFKYFHKPFQGKAGQEEGL